MTYKPLIDEAFLLGRRDELVAQIKTIEESSPRAERDARHEELTRAELATFKEKIRAHEKDLPEMKRELSRISLLLGGKRFKAGPLKR